MPCIASSRTSTGVIYSVSPLWSTCVSTMNCANARCTRATAPFNITKRAPDVLAAVSKSIKGVTLAISKCSFGLKSKLGASPQRFTSTLSFSSAPFGTSSAGRLGIRASMSFSCASRSLASACMAVTSAFLSLTRLRSRSNSASSLLALAAPTSFDALFCSA